MTKIKNIYLASKKYKELFWQKYNQSGLDWIHSFFYSPKHEVIAAFLLSIETTKELCQFLQTDFQTLESIINEPFYHQFTISKKKGGKREISAPDVRLKFIQKRLNYFLQGYYLSIKPSNVYGFVINPHYLGKTCNIVENAKNHVGKKYVLNIDLKDFFDKISARQVFELFSSDTFGFNKEIAIALTLLTTFKGKLPQGAPTSPVLSNFICMQLDAALNEFAKSANLNYSRYADDLTFSSNSKIENDSILDIINIINRNQFTINEHKLRQHKSNSKQTVTGIIVNEKPNVDRKFIKRTRAMLNDLVNNGLEKASANHFKYGLEIGEKHQQQFFRRLEGNINFIGQVRGKSDFLYLQFKIGFEAFSIDNQLI
jgi:RNA-directed DNA polymerase